MDIIFVTLKNYFLIPTLLLQKFGCRLFYLKIDSELERKNPLIVQELKNKHILPLPLESLQSISDPFEGYSDPEMKILNISKEYIPKNFTHCFEQLFPNVSNITKKMEIMVNRIFARKMRSVTSFINIWARDKPDQKHILIDVQLSGLLTPGLEPNVILLIIPIDIIEKPIRLFIYKAYAIIRLLFKVIGLPNEQKQYNDVRFYRPFQPRVAFVNDSAGPLIYSSNTESELYRENLLHLYYRNFPESSEKQKWSAIWKPTKLFRLATISDALVAIRHGILRVRSFKQIIGLILITCHYIQFRFFLQQLEKYPSLELAIIRNEIICPKPLLLAFEEKGIQTMALQYRFDVSNNNLVGSTFLNYYLCASQFVADLMQESKFYCINKFIPVGLYRSDIIHQRRTSPPPDTLRIPIFRGCRIITALGWQIPLYWQESQLSFRLGWTAQTQFLEDMYRLSEELPDVFIILRYENIDWMTLPIFAEIVSKIRASENIAISTEYNKKNFTYNLCAHSSLVIINKHDRIANECLSIGIPVLFHNYSPNNVGFIWNVYKDSKVMCNNYTELLNRSRIVLGESPNEMTNEYNLLQKVVLGDFGDGRVKERVHAFVNEILSQESDKK